MDFQYISPELPRRLDGWRSAALGIEMPVVVYGERGHPLLLFPTAAADYLECERFFLIQAIEPQILAGQIQVFSIDSINSMQCHLHGPHGADLARQRRPVRQAGFQQRTRGHHDDQRVQRSNRWPVP